MTLIDCIKLFIKYSISIFYLHLQVPINNTTEVITNPDTMINQLIHRNQQHFGQAQGTPFTISPLDKVLTLDHLRELPTEEVASTSEAVQEIIKYLTTVPPQPLINTIFTANDLYQIYSCWNEQTTTSPSGLHLGHDKCPIKYTSQNNESTVGHRLLTIKAHLINLALKYNIQYPRWQNINTIMIEKIPGNYNITKLRALHIFFVKNLLFNVLSQNSQHEK